MVSPDSVIVLDFESEAEAECKGFCQKHLCLDIPDKELSNLCMLPGLLHIIPEGRDEAHGEALGEGAALIGAQQLVL